MNQVIIAYHAVCEGDVRLSAPSWWTTACTTSQDVKCWPAGTGYALAEFLRSRGYVPQFIDPVWRKDIESTGRLKSAPTPESSLHEL